MKEVRATSSIDLAPAADRRVDRDGTAPALMTHEPFIGHFAHGLRSALNGIAGWAAVLEDRRLSGPVSPLAERAVAGIRRGVEQQVRLIEVVCDATELLAGRRCIHPAPMRLRSALDVVVERMRDAIEHRSIDFIGDIGLADESIDGDHERVVQVFEELLRNSARCTPAGGRIRLTAGSVRDRAIVTIEDTGRGLPPDFEAWLFDPLRALGHDRIIDGDLGLGLPVAKVLVEGHGGSIEAHSRGPGQGTRMTVALPLRGSAPRRR